MAKAAKAAKGPAKAEKSPPKVRLLLALNYASKGLLPKALTVN